MYQGLGMWYEQQSSSKQLSLLVGAYLWLIDSLGVGITMWSWGFLFLHPLNPSLWQTAKETRLNMGNRHQLRSILLSCFSIWYSKKSGSSAQMGWKLGHKGVNKRESKGRATRGWNKASAIKGKALAQNKEHPRVLLFSALYFPFFFFPGKWGISKVLTSWTGQFYSKKRRQWCVTA